jgi:hypothetical protein
MIFFSLKARRVRSSGNSEFFGINGEPIPLHLRRFSPKNFSTGVLLFCSHAEQKKLLLQREFLFLDFGSSGFS